VVPADKLAAFAVTAFLLIIVPGPSVLFVVSRGVALGRRAALATVVGNAAGAYVQMVLVAFGLGALVTRSVTVFTALKLVGAVYIVYLGAKAWRQRRELATVLDLGVSARSVSRILGEGFVVGITNPKTTVFFAAVLPQFVDRSAGNVTAQMLVLGLVFTAIALVSDSTWGLAAGTARHWLADSPHRLSALGGAGGLVMVGLGLQMAVTGRKD
jgi:threonine/homoserine/homoserine lactone efflux protein